MDFVKHKTLFNRVVLVDGTAHSGKLLLGPILSTYKGVEIHKLETVFEHIAVLYHFKKMSLDAAVTLMRNYLDESFYNSIIGRNINFRPSDMSSVFNGKNQRRYLDRLFSEEGEAAVKRITDEKPVCQYLTHEILGFIEPCFEAFGDKLYIVEVIRHPVNMVDRWLNRGWGNDRFGLDPRSFIICFEHGGRQVPYFAHSFRDHYHAMSDVERVIHCINSCNSQILRSFESLSAERKSRVLFVKFEELVTQSRPELDRIRDFLGLAEGDCLEEVMAEQRCPRVLDLSGRDAMMEKYLSAVPASTQDLLVKMVRDYENFDPYSFTPVKAG